MRFPTSLSVRINTCDRCKFFFDTSSPPTVFSNQGFLGNIMVFAPMWISFVVNTMLNGELPSYSTSSVSIIIQVIVMVRLYAMYQRSRKMFIFLVLIFLVLTITCGVIAAIKSHRLYGGKLQLLKTCTHQAHGIKTR